MKRKIHNSDCGKLKIAGLISGSGNSLWKIYELQKELEATWEGSPFEVVGCFSSAPEAKGVLTAEELGIPVESLDLRAFYRERGKKFADMSVRREYDLQLTEKIEKFDADIIILAGYVWATTDVILDKYTLLNVHPADLAVKANGKRAFAGANGVGDALAAGQKTIHASSHLATKEIDNGPILCISPGVPIDYSILEELGEKDFMRKYLREVNSQSRLTGARTVYEIAVGNFEIDNEHNVYYKGELLSEGLRIESWEENVPLYDRSIHSLVSPSSLAVIGASSKGGIGKAVVDSMLAVGYSGRLYAVNRKAEKVSGTAGYSSVLDIPGELETAVIAVPSPFVLEVAEECGKKGVKALICVSAGFRETGKEGALAEEKLMGIVNRYNMRMIGPNCMGICSNNEEVNLNATILHDTPDTGNIAFITQSGGLGAVLLDYSEHLGIGFSTVASLGNQADVTVNDLLPFLAEDEKTKVILLYLETIPDFRRFRQLASRISSKKPIILLKSGRTESGARAAGSHTGSLAGNDMVTDSLLKNCGILRADNIYDAFFTASVLAKMKRPAGRRIAVVTNGGGPGILLSDALGAAGLEVPTLSASSAEKLKPKLLPEASCGNPIDLVAAAAPGHYVDALKEVMESGEFDAVALLCIPPATVSTGAVAEGIVEGFSDFDPEKMLPMVACFFGPSLGADGRRVLNTAGYPCVEYPEQIAAVLALGLEEDRRPIGEQKELRLPLYRREEAFELFKSGDDGFLSQELAWNILDFYGFSTAAPILVRSADQIPDDLNKFPLVAKVDHPEVVHKSDAGGVLLGLSSMEEVVEAVEGLFHRFPGARGVILQPQIEAGQEVILGSFMDETAGQAVMVGLGGTFVELMKDVAFISVPFDRGQAEDALLSLKSSPLLKGYRGAPGTNIDSLLDQMEKMNQMLLDFPNIREMDLNPLIYSREKERFIIADVRIRI